MTDAAVFAGTYADFKTVKTRSVVQAVIEIPVEQAEAFLKVFGVPRPGAERPVAIALLNTAKPELKQPKAKKPLSRSQHAGMLCHDEQFQFYLGAKDEEDAARRVRDYCLVDSRSQFDTNENAAARWDALLLDFQQQTGRAAELRS